MKKWFLLLAIPLYSISFCSPLQDHKIDLNALSQLAAALAIPQEEDLISTLQKHWLRQPGKELWEVVELPPEQRQLVLEWAEKQGLFTAWRPALKNYDKALILGASTSRMERRLAHLIELWTNGIRFNETVWLTGDRPLDARVEKLAAHCSTESEAAHHLWEKAELPQEMRNLPVIFIAVPMKTEGASLMRPNTEDTLAAWVKRAPQSCSALFVSNQPYCGYQFAVIKRCLPVSIQFDVVGEGVGSTDQLSAAAVLDTIARWAYQENL